MQSKSARDKKEKHTERWEEMFHDKVRAGAVVFRDGEQASVQEKNGSASEPVSKRGREKERERKTVSQSHKAVCSSSAHHYRQLLD